MGQFAQVSIVVRGDQVGDGPVIIALHAGDGVRTLFVFACEHGQPGDQVIAAKAQKLWGQTTGVHVSEPASQLSSSTPMSPLRSSGVISCSNLPMVLSHVLSRASALMASVKSPQTLAIPVGV